MKRTASFLRQLQALFACLLASLLISCATKELERCPPGTPGIILSQPVECTHKDGRFTLPAGHYQAEAQSPKGIYYAAPERLKTDGIIRAGQERGGLFIAREGWQWAWTGHPGWEAEQSATTITGKRGIIMPTHYKFEPWVRYQVAKQQRDAQRIVASGHKDNGALALELIQQVSQVAIFPLGWYKKILLN
jgi:hypothetical protein